MNITLNNSVDQYSNFNVIGVDKAKKEEAPKNAINFNQDSVSFSNAGKAMSQMDKLNKQKENLQEKREELLQKSLAGEDIGDEIEKLDEKMIEIEAEILNAKQKEAEKATKDSSEKAIKAEPKTKEEVMFQKISNVISSSISTDQKEAVESKSIALSLNKKMTEQVEHIEEELVEVKEPHKKIDEAHQEKEHTEKEYKEDREHITIDVVL
ncbi:hypothetical protein AN639_03040 [Candidatus Epulonipiscium fishelsonii]|uniref:Uncharacterized protein n=1 Tax=Candidatus Epulonipiscium fishelsonii TaxID=77094 RepID=A0ACC8X9S2_9FIRM|nr:hypothetical protein AN396_01440 [Epulopiscium sp. SCG-B11WGA-EpuloA1]ONI41718.1 hypothetical protein AN639_03040 [Epulopiscium sp. SCG-B05WGA-EpuloA1]